MVLFSSCLDAVAMEETCASEAGSVDMEGGSEHDTRATPVPDCGFRNETDVVFRSETDDRSVGYSIGSQESDLRFQERVAGVVAGQHLELWSKSFGLCPESSQEWRVVPEVQHATIAGKQAANRNAWRIGSKRSIESFGTVQDSDTCEEEDANKAIVGEQIVSLLSQTIGTCYAGP